MINYGELKSFCEHDLRERLEVPTTTEAIRLEKIGIYFELSLRSGKFDRYPEFKQIAEEFLQKVF